MFRIFKIYTFLFIFGFLISPVFADEKKNGTEHDGPMEHYAVHLDEVIVSTPMQDTIASSATPVTVLHNDNLRMKSGSTIGETLQNELGVHGQSWRRTSRDPRPRWSSCTGLEQRPGSQ